MGTGYNRPRGRGSIRRRRSGWRRWGAVIVGNIDNVIRPYVFRRWAQIHPFVTIIGAFAGIKYFGLLGLLDRPARYFLFFELIRMYRAEYLSDEAALVSVEGQTGQPVRSIS